MRVYILSRNKGLYSTKRLVEAGEQRGWDIRVIDYLKCSIEISKGQLAISYLGEDLPAPDAIIPRIGASRTFYGTAMVRHFEVMDTFSVAGNLAIARSRDKLRSLQVLSKHNVDMPKTVFASNKSTAKDVIALSGGAPLVLKILEGTQGVGVVLVDTEKAAKSVLDAFYGMDVNLLVQEFIEEAGGADIRALVVGGEVVGAMKRQGAEGDFRSNLHQGGHATAYKLNRKEKAMALAAAKAMGLGVCGVDMIPSARGPLVMEVNSSPGLEGIEKSTGIDIAGKIMDYIEQNVTPKSDTITKKEKSKGIVSEHNMSTEKFILGGVDVPRGIDTTIYIEFPKLYNTPTHLPVRVIRGKKDGPVVFISAAIHGDELNGIEIIRRLRKLNILKKLKGILILVPVVNVYGMMNLSRYLPDRRDLNRSFPGSSKGSLAGRIAKIFFDEIVSKCSLGIDLHTASIHKSNLPQIRTNIDNEYTFMLAKEFEAPVVLHSELRDGSLRAVAQDKGVPILLYEAGEALRFDEQSIRIGVKGIVNVLRANDMLPKVINKKKSKTPVITKTSKWIRATDSGILRTIKALGDTVAKNDVIAYIDEPLGDDSFEILSPFDGIIIGKSELPLIQEGDAIFHIANFKNLEMADNKIEYFGENAIEQSEFYELNSEEIIE